VHAHFLLVQLEVKNGSPVDHRHGRRLTILGLLLNLTVILRFVAGFSRLTTSQSRLKLSLAAATRSYLRSSIEPHQTETEPPFVGRHCTRRTWLWFLFRSFIPGISPGAVRVRDAYSSDPMPNSLMRRAADSERGVNSQGTTCGNPI